MNAVIDQQRQDAEEYSILSDRPRFHNCRAARIDPAPLMEQIALTAIVKAASRRAEVRASARRNASQTVNRSLIPAPYP